MVEHKDSTHILMWTRAPSPSQELFDSLASAFSLVSLANGQTILYFLNLYLLGGAG